ncbi:hypothetical protein HYY71_06985 [Candidatus Woesearchaeota archaeon]|nr:hypothetical protein [Candidatus Woesearchaeota archaeon]
MNGYSDLLREYSAQTDELLAQLAANATSESSRISAIKSKLVDLVGDADLLRFLQARQTSADLVGRLGDSNYVSLSPLGHIEFHMFTPNHYKRSYALKGDQFECVASSINGHRKGDKLNVASEFHDNQEPLVTADLINTNLYRSLESIAQKPSG